MFDAAEQVSVLAEVDLTNTQDAEPKASAEPEVTSPDKANAPDPPVSLPASLTDEQRKQAVFLLREFPDLFRASAELRAPASTSVQHDIKLKPGTRPVSQPPYRVSPAEREFITSQIADMTERGFVEPSKSP
jgi:hypothetical protein